MKRKAIIFICGLFLISGLSGCLSTISTNKDIINSLTSIYKDYNVEILDASDDCMIIKIEKGE